MSSTISMQGLTLIATTASEKSRLMLDLIEIMLDDVKSGQSHSRTRSRSRASGHTACLKTISRTITMQGLTLTAITTSEKCA